MFFEFVLTRKAKTNLIIIENKKLLKYQNTKL